MSIIIQPGHHTQKAQRMSEYLRTTTLGGPPQGTKRKTRSRPEIRALTGAGQQIGDFMWKLTMSKTWHHGLARARHDKECGESSRRIDVGGHVV